MIVLGLDPGLGKGSAWAVMGGLGLYTGVLRGSATDDIPRACEQAEQLYRVIATHQVEVVVLETQFGQLTKDTTAKERDGMTHAALRLAFLRGALGYSAMESGCRVIEVAPATVKKAVTGNGRASKQQVQDAIEAQFGVKLSQDRADAVAIAVAGERKAKAEDLGLVSGARTRRPRAGQKTLFEEE